MGKKGRGKKRKRGAEGGNGGKGKGGGKGSSNEGKGKRHCTGERPERAFVVCSATPQQSPKATKEAQRLLGSALETLWQPKEAEPAVAAQEQQRSVSDALEAELRELRGGDESGAKVGGRPRIKFYGEVTRGVAVLSCPSESSAPGFPRPSALVNSVFKAQTNEIGPCARFVVRLLPLDAVCPPHLSNFRAAALASLPTLFAGARSGASWYFTYFGRAMSTIKRDDALQVLKEVLGPLGYEISVSEAEYTILVEVNPSLCGFSVLRDYEGSLHECNLQRVSRKRDLEDGDDDSDEELSEDDLEEAREDTDEADPKNATREIDDNIVKDEVDIATKLASDAQIAEPNTESVG